MKKKTKKTNRCKLACQLIQLFARLRDTDINGYGHCCSCGKQLSWSEGQGGHWHPKTRGYNAASLIEQNCNLQCATCNLYRQGDIANYTQFMLEKYGNKIMRGIACEGHAIMDKEFVEGMIIELRAKCKELAKTKNFVVRVP